ncbi:MAG: hypothetical protein K8L99_23895 [Anaerolineae bacterium]|nr:hypothetical protein [Anaerolineae bacterium]
MNILNQYSYILISLGVIFVSILLLRRYLVSTRVLSSAVLSLVILSAAGFFLLRPGAGDTDSLSVAEATLNNGKPTFLEFFSNYCAGCLAVRPVVDRYAEDLADSFNVLRVDIHTDVGRELRGRYDFSFTPEFLLFNREGEVVWRGHTPPPDEQIAVATSQSIGAETP